MALHGVYRAVMGWPTPPETLGKCGKVKIVHPLFGNVKKFPYIWTMKAKAMAYAAAAKCGATIDYEVGDRRWTVNVNAPDGMMWNGDTYSLVTSWLTKPTEEFWMDVLRDIESNAPHLQHEEQEA